MSRRSNENDRRHPRGEHFELALFVSQEHSSQLVYSGNAKAMMFEPEAIATYWWLSNI